VCRAIDAKTNHKPVDTTQWTLVITVIGHHRYSAIDEPVLSMNKQKTYVEHVFNGQIASVQHTVQSTLKKVANTPMYQDDTVEDNLYKNDFVFRVFVYPREIMRRIIAVAKKQTSSIQHMCDTEQKLLENLLPVIAKSMGEDILNDKKFQERRLAILESMQKFIEEGDTHKFRFCFLRALHREKTIQTLVRQMVADKERFDRLLKNLAVVFDPGKSQCPMGDFNSVNGYQRLVHFIGHICGVYMMCVDV
jgi:hypothetical protein